MSTQENTNNKVTLYIATHNTTGKKYFGKTTRYFTEEDLQKYYHGSGTHWLQYIEENGDDVTMEIYGIYSLDENSDDYVKPIALKFSEENNIVESLNWSNKKKENGLDGGCIGYPHTNNSIYKIKQAMKNLYNNNWKNTTTFKNSRKKTSETMLSKEWKDTVGVKRIEKIKESKRKNYNGIIHIIDDKGIIKYVVDIPFRMFLRENSNLPLNTFYNAYRNNKPVNKSYNKEYGNWTIKKIR